MSEKIFFLPQRCGFPAIVRMFCLWNSIQLVKIFVWVFFFKLWLLFYCLSFSFPEESTLLRRFFFMNIQKAFHAQHCMSSLDHAFDSLAIHFTGSLMHGLKYAGQKMWTLEHTYTQINQAYTHVYASLCVCSCLSLAHPALMLVCECERVKEWNRCACVHTDTHVNIVSLRFALNTGQLRMRGVDET